MRKFAGAAEGIFAGLVFAIALAALAFGQNIPVPSGAPPAIRLPFCTGAGGSPVCNGSVGVVTTSVLTTAANTLNPQITVTNVAVNPNSAINCNVSGYSGTFHTNGVPVVAACTGGTGTLGLFIFNTDSANALNGNVLISFSVTNAP